MADFPTLSVPPELFKIGYPPGQLFTIEMENGDINQRPRFTKLYEIFEIEYQVLPNADLAVLEAFLETVAWGNIAFNYTTPTGLGPFSCKFLDIPMISYAGFLNEGSGASNFWQVSFRLINLDGFANPSVTTFPLDPANIVQSGYGQLYSDPTDRSDLGKGGLITRRAFTKANKGITPVFLAVPETDMNDLRNFMAYLRGSGSFAFTDPILGALTVRFTELPLYDWVEYDGSSHRYDISFKLEKVV